MDVLDKAGDILTTIDEKLIALMKEQKYSRISPVKQTTNRSLKSNYVSYLFDSRDCQTQTEDHPSNYEIQPKTPIEKSQPSLQNYKSVPHLDQRDVSRIYQQADQQNRQYNSVTHFQHFSEKLLSQKQGPTITDRLKIIEQQFQSKIDVLMNENSELKRQLQLSQNNNYLLNEQLSKIQDEMESKGQTLEDKLKERFKGLQEGLGMEIIHQEQEFEHRMRLQKNQYQTTLKEKVNRISMLEEQVRSLKVSISQCTCRFPSILSDKPSSDQSVKNDTPIHQLRASILYNSNIARTRQITNITD